MEFLLNKLTVLNKLILKKKKKNCRIEDSQIERPSLGRSILTMPPSSPEQIFLNDEKPKYTLKQLKRTMNHIIFFFNEN